MSKIVDAKTTLSVNGTDYEIYGLSAVKEGHVSRLPYSLKILLENLLRHAASGDVRAADISALANWDPKARNEHEIAFTPARVVLQDFTGVPAVVDLAAMRDAVVKLGGKADAINPLSPAELVIDHSVQVDSYGSPGALEANTVVEFTRNQERYGFLRWGQDAFRNFKVVPPNTGIVHQVNLEYLSRVVFSVDKSGRQTAYPDTVVGTDSHTTMINGLGVLGWGVGGIEAEAAMLGQPVTMLIPEVIGFRLTGQLREGTTATDLVLTVTEILRKKGVVGKFVEFFGDGLSNLPLADRATIGNMSPEFGSTVAIFPIDGETIRYLELSGRPAQEIALITAYAKVQGLWRNDGQADPLFTDVVALDLATVEPSVAGPSRPQDRIGLRSLAATYRKIEAEQIADGKTGTAPVQITSKGQTFDLANGAVLIAAITSCTNTSNPYVMVAAGLLARNAVQRGLTTKPWVKTSLAPGSRVVSSYLDKSGLTKGLNSLGFNIVGFGCTTCIGNSGPLDPPVEKAVREGKLIGCSVLSGNRNFEGRIHPLVRNNFLASPPLVVAYALAGSLNIDLNTEPLGTAKDGSPVYLKDIWPDQKEVQSIVTGSLDSEMFRKSYADVFAGDKNWNSIKVPRGDRFAWAEDSTYVRNPPYFEGMTLAPAAVTDIAGARVLALLGNSVTTDHISPAGSIGKDTPAGRYLLSNGVQVSDFNQYGARRGNHEVMMRGTFANIRLRNQLVPGTEGGYTAHLPSGDKLSIYDAAMRYAADKVPLVILAGKEYGSGSSRDWAAKGTKLLGVRAVIAESYERIHRSNLIGMGVLPLEFQPGQSAASLDLSGREVYDISGLDEGRAREVTVVAQREDGKKISFRARVRIDTPKEREYFAHGGILHYVYGSSPRLARRRSGDVAGLIDVGANLTHESFRDDLPEVIERAVGCGVRRLIVTGTSRAASEAAVALASAKPGVLWATAGVHPHSAREYDDAAEDALRTLLKNPFVVAAGECGLDYYRDYAPRDLQRRVFARQLELAAHSGRPLFLHQRDAHGDFLAILKEQGSRLPTGVAHCFTNGPSEVEDYLNIGLHIGITGWICDDRRAQDLRAAVACIPLDRVVVETDSPYLLPRSLRPLPRGRRNEPATLPEVVRVLAVFMGHSPEVVAEATTRNAEVLFGLSGGLQ